MFNREIPILFLKATIKKTILVPGYYRNGVYVAPHQKMVHYDPDKDVKSVISGNGSHSQKQAHKKLSKLPEWHSWSDDDKHAHVLSSATNIQNKATQAAQVSTFMSKVKSGAMPSEAEFAAFIAQPTNAFKDKVAILEAGSAPVGLFKKLGDKMEAANAAAPKDDIAVQNMQNLADFNDAEAKKAPEVKFPTHIDDYIKLVNAGITPGVHATEAYLDYRNSPDNVFEISALDSALGSDEVSKKTLGLALDAYTAYVDAQKSEHDHYAKLVGDAASGPKYLKEAYKDLATGNHEWELKHPKDQHADLMALYAKKQGAATASAAVSGWKKNAHAGKAPTPSQWKAYNELPIEKKVALAADAVVAAGKDSHLVNPNAEPIQPKVIQSKYTFGQDNEGVVFSDGSYSFKHENGAWHYKSPLHVKWKEVGDQWESALNSGENTSGIKLFVKPNSSADPDGTFGADNEGSIFSDGETLFKYSGGSWLHKIGSDDNWLPVLTASGVKKLNSGTSPSGSNLLVYVKSNSKLASEMVAAVDWDSLVKYGSPAYAKQLNTLKDAAEAGNIEAVKLAPVGHHNDLQYAKDAILAAVGEGPKDGDTKEGADGTLVFKDGRWHKQEDGQGYVTLKDHPHAKYKLGVVKGVEKWVFEADGYTYSTPKTTQAKLYIKTNMPVPSWVTNGMAEPDKIDIINESSEEFGISKEAAQALLNGNGQSSSLGERFETLDGFPSTKYKLEDFDGGKQWVGYPNDDESSKYKVALGVQAALFIKTKQPVPDWISQSLTTHQKIGIINDVSDEFGISKMEAQALLDGDDSYSSDLSFAPAAPVAQDAETATDLYHYANTSAGHNKFWQIQVVGNKMITTYGKIGSKGSSTVKEFPSHAEAFVAMDKLQKEKLKGGYFFTKKEQVTDVPDVAVDPAAPKKMSAAVKKLDAIDADAVQAWMLWSGLGAKQAPPSTAFFDHATKAANTKFHKWNGAAKKATFISVKEAYRSAAIASLYGMPDHAMLNDGTFVKSPFFSDHNNEVGFSADPVKIKAAAIAFKMGNTEPKVIFTKPAAPNTGGWSYNPKDMGLSYAPTLTKDAGDKSYYIAFEKESGTYQVGVLSSDGSDVDYFEDATTAKDAADVLSKFIKNNGHSASVEVPSVTAIGGLMSGGMPDNYFSGTKPAGPKEGDTMQGVDGMLVLKNGHWVKMDEPVEPSNVSPNVFGAGVTNANGWAQTGPQAGSNAGGKFKDKAGKEWYCKFPADPDVVRNELLAAKFYEMFGVPAAKVKLIEKDGKLGLASKWVDGLSKGTPATLKDAHAGFAVDAWLANWDVVGLANDNLLKGPDGAVRVDVGGSLLYRAMGEAKGDAFGDTVTELDSLLDPKVNVNSAKVFAKISPEDLKAGGEKIALITNEQIHKMVEMFGPGDWPAKNTLAKKLIARRRDIMKKLNIADPWNKPAPDETALPVNKDDLPAAKDFSNWEGSGKGLSSSESVNKQNTIDHAKLLDFAMQGNLVALKNYQYEAIDKSTGKSLGYKPIGDHPSKWVKEDWGYLVEMLDTIAHPSVAGLDLPSLGGGLDDIANDSGFFKLGQRVATISADKRLGFWMKLAHAGDDFAEIVPKATTHVTSSVISASKAAFNKLSGITRAFIARIQANGSVNHIFSAGNSTVSVWGNGGNYDGGIGGLVQAAYQDAEESPEGTMLYRWMDMPNSMVDQLLAEKPGLIFQNTDSMCCSHKEAWSKSSHFSSQALVKIKYAKGAKALHSFASGDFSSENEITTLPGARFMLLSAKKGNVAGGKIEMEVLMLPPHEGFVTDVANQAKLGKSLFIVIKDKIKGLLWNR